MLGDVLFRLGLRAVTAGYGIQRTVTVQVPYHETFGCQKTAINLWLLYGSSKY